MENNTEYWIAVAAYQSLMDAVGHFQRQQPEQGLKVSTLEDPGLDAALLACGYGKRGDAELSRHLSDRRPIADQARGPIKKS